MSAWSESTWHEPAPAYSANHCVHAPTPLFRTPRCIDRGGRAKACRRRDGDNHSALNLRASASTSGAVKLVMPAGATVENRRARLSNGFYRNSLYQGIGGYAHGDYLSFGGLSASYPTAAQLVRPEPLLLNLRAGPSTSDRVLLVMPSGASITLTGDKVHGSRSHLSGYDWLGILDLHQLQRLSLVQNGSNHPGSGQCWLRRNHVIAQFAFRGEYEQLLSFWLCLRVQQ